MVCLTIKLDKIYFLQLSIWLNNKKYINQKDNNKNTLHKSKRKCKKNVFLHWSRRNCYIKYTNICTHHKNTLFTISLMSFINSFSWNQKLYQNSFFKKLFIMSNHLFPYLLFNFISQSIICSIWNNLKIFSSKMYNKGIK